MAKLFVKRLDTKTATKGAYFKGCTKRKYTPPTHTHTQFYIGFVVYNHK